MVIESRRFAAEGLPPMLRAATQRGASVKDSTASFAQQLAVSLESYFNQSASTTPLEIAISPQTSPDSGVRQFLVTVKNPQVATLPQAIPAPAAPAPVEKTAFTDEADAYWAMQPKEVQVLRTILDENERGEVGLQLAKQGFSIDPHIMIYGLDPYMTMKIRQDEGYTWIPALGQGGNMNRPGFNFPGMLPYDPFNPPPGSVKVTIDFAKGLEHTSPGNAHMKGLN